MNAQCNVVGIGNVEIPFLEYLYIFVYKNICISLEVGNVQADFWGGKDNFWKDNV